MQAITFGARDHVTFEVRLSYIIQDFFLRGWGGGRILHIKINFKKSRELNNENEKQDNTRHFGNNSQEKTSTKRFCLPTKRRDLRPLTSYSSV